MTRRSGYVVSGAAGFVGSHVANHLADTSPVIGIVRSSPPDCADNYTTVVSDLAQSAPSIGEIAAPTIIHAAAVMRGDTHDDFWRGNVVTTYNMLECAVQTKARHFVYFSTGGVYPYAFDTLHDEACELEPIGFYGHTKWIGECLARSYHHLYGIPITIIRLFFPYGAAQQRGVFQFIARSVRDGSPMTIKPHGAPKMNPVHIDDVLSAIDLIDESADGCRIFNLCGNEFISFREAVGLFEEKYNRQAELTEVPDAEGDLLGNNEKLKRELGWQPRFGIHEIANAIG